MKNLRKLICVLLASAMMLSMAACGGEQTSTGANTTTPTETEAETEDTTSAETTETADDRTVRKAFLQRTGKPMKQEPAFGTELTYIYNGGNCVSAKYMADVLGYYEEYGINAKIVQGRFHLHGGRHRPGYVGHRPHRGPCWFRSPTT